MFSSSIQKKFCCCCCCFIDLEIQKKNIHEKLWNEPFSSGKNRMCVCVNQFGKMRKKRHNSSKDYSLSHSVCSKTIFIIIITMIIITKDYHIEMKCVNQFHFISNRKIVNKTKNKKVLASRTEI